LAGSNTPLANTSRSPIESPLRPEIHGGLAHRPFDDFDLFGGKSRQCQKRRRERRDAADCDVHGVPFDELS